MVDNVSGYASYASMEKEDVRLGSVLVADADEVEVDEHDEDVRTNAGRDILAGAKVEFVKLPNKEVGVPELIGGRVVVDNEPGKLLPPKKLLPTDEILLSIDEELGEILIEDDCGEGTKTNVLEPEFEVVRLEVSYELELEIAELAVMVEIGEYIDEDKEESKFADVVVTASEDVADEDERLDTLEL